MRSSLLIRSPGSQRGFALLESVVTMALLGILVTSSLGGLLFGITQARQSVARAAAAAWGQAELDYLALQGYQGLSASTHTVGQSTEYTMFGDYPEPRIPEGFDHAVVSVQDLPGMPVRQVTVALYQTSLSPYAIFSTYISSVTQP